MPRVPSAFLTIATRHRTLAAEVAEVFTDVVEELDATEVWSQLKRWTGSMAALRYVALRNARASVRAAARPGQLETDEAMLVALEAVSAERACREALTGAAEPARRWFGDLGGDVLSLDLARIEEAAAWGSELRRAFDQVTIHGGESGRQAAWRALVAQVAASPAATNNERPAVELAPLARLAAAVARWEPRCSALSRDQFGELRRLRLRPRHENPLSEQRPSFEPIELLPETHHLADHNDRGRFHMSGRRLLHNIVQAPHNGSLRGSRPPPDAGDGCGALFTFGS